MAETLQTQITLALAKIMGDAQSRGDTPTQMITAVLSAFQSTVVNLENMVLNQEKPQPVVNNVTINGGSIPIAVVNGNNGDRVEHGLGTENILVSAKDSEGYQDMYTSAKADGPNHMILRTPSNEQFNGTLIVDPVQTI